MWVRFPSPAPEFERREAPGNRKVVAQVAQLVEHTLGKGEVSGSNPLMSSSIKADMQISAFYLMVA